MHYKSLTVWIFIILLIMIALLFIYPTPLVIGICVVGLPIFVFIQAWIVLRAKDESKHKFDDDKWYEDKEG